jgi:phospholipid transport system substrate-binding protein
MALDFRRNRLISNALNSKDLAMKHLLAAAALALAPVAALAQGTTPAPAAAVDAKAEAKSFATDLTARATTALTSKKPKAQQLADFRAVLTDALALDVIGKFILGETRKTMTPAQIARYDAALPKYLTKLYAEQFAPIVGKPLTVVDAKQIGKDVIVRSRLARAGGAPVNIDWRVRKLKSGETRAVDIMVSGVSIMLVKREEFSGFVAQKGVDALLAEIEKGAA